jgi:hypothetical protein
MPQTILDHFNKHEGLHFIHTKESNNQIAYFDVNQINKQHYVDRYIENSQLMPPRRTQMATFKSWIHRLNKLPLNKANTYIHTYTL